MVNNPKSISVFRILVSYFNTNLNNFIVECHKAKEQGRRYTGGLMDVVFRQYHPYYELADELIEIREQIFLISNQIERANDAITEQILSRLFNIYQIALEDIKRHHKTKADLGYMLLLPMRKMFFELDQDLMSDRLKERINQMHLKQAGTLFKIKKFFLNINPEKKQEAIRKEIEPLWDFKSFH